MTERIRALINEMREIFLRIENELSASGVVCEKQTSPYIQPLETILEPLETPVSSRNRGGSRGGKKKVCQEKNDSTNKTAPNEIFHKFYVEYPKHVGRGAAIRALDRALKKATIEQIVEGAKKYAAWCLRNGVESKYVCLPATWLNQERWADELPEDNPVAIAKRINDLERERRKLAAEFDDVTGIDKEIQHLKGVLRTT